MHYYSQQSKQLGALLQTVYWSPFTEDVALHLRSMWFI
jgi:hypothetical protein